MRSLPIIFVLLIPSYIHAYDYYFSVKYKSIFPENKYTLKNSNYVSFDAFSIYYTHIYSNVAKTHDHTQTITAGSPAMNVLFGNFYAQYGSGLAISYGSTTKNTFNHKRFACLTNANTNGDPKYSFSGIALNKIFRGFHFNSFLSLNERFIAASDFENNSVDSSIRSIMSNTKSSYLRNEPVTIYTIGNAFEFIDNPYITVSVYSALTMLKSANETIHWDPYGTNRQIAYHSLYGMYLSYKDRFIETFHEVSQSNNCFVTKKSQHFAISHQTGFYYKIPSLRFSCIQKSIPAQYYSPYGNPAGNRTQSDALILSLTYYLNKNTYMQGRSAYEKINSYAAQPFLHRTGAVFNFHFSKRWIVESSISQYKQDSIEGDKSISNSSYIKYLLKNNGFCKISESLYYGKNSSFNSKIDFRIFFNAWFRYSLSFLINNSLINENDIDVQDNIFSESYDMRYYQISTGFSVATKMLLFNITYSVRNKNELIHIITISCSGII